MLKTSKGFSFCNLGSEPGLNLNFCPNLASLLHLHAPRYYEHILSSPNSPITQINLGFGTRHSLTFPPGDKLWGIFYWAMKKGQMIGSKNYSLTYWGQNYSLPWLTWVLVLMIEWRGVWDWQRPVVWWGIYWTPVNSVNNNKVHEWRS